MLKKIIIFFVVLFSIELINVYGRVSKEFLENKKISGNGDFTVAPHNSILYGYYEGDTFEFFNTTNETDKIYVEYYIECGAYSIAMGDVNFCNLISYEGTDVDLEKQREFVKLLGFTKCPMEKGNYKLLKFGLPDPDVIAILLDERCGDDAHFKGTLNFFINTEWAIQYEYTLKANLV